MAGRSSPGVGYVIHDGELVLPAFRKAIRAMMSISASRKSILGSRDLFRTSLALNRDLDGQMGRRK